MRHSIDVVKGHEGDREIGARVLQRQCGGIGDPQIHRRVRGAGGRDHRGRRIDADDAMPELFQVPRQSSFAAADVDRPQAGRRQQGEELVAVKSPVAVMSGMPRPCDPSAGLRFPIVGKIHAELPCSWRDCDTAIRQFVRALAIRDRFGTKRAPRDVVEQMKIIDARPALVGKIIVVARAPCPPRRTSRDLQCGSAPTPGWRPRVRRRIWRCYARP